MTTSFVKENFTLDDFVASPPKRTEWVDGQLVEKNDMTLRHGEIQLRLGRYWEDYKDSSGQGGQFTRMCLAEPISRGHHQM